MEAHARGSVLVVDDEPTIAEVVSRYLERAGYRTQVAGDGVQALAAVASDRPDLVVLDLMLPGIDGLEVMRRMREQGSDPIATILLTAKGEESDRVVGLRLGADDYVVKPFSPAELVARVDAVLRRVDTTPDRAQPLHCSDLTIDPTSRRVHVRGEEVQLTQREFDVLLFLARHPGSGVLAQPSDGRDLAVLVLHRHLDGHGPHPAAARQDRARPGAAAPHRDRVGRRLPVRAVTDVPTPEPLTGARRGASRARSRRPRARGR